MLNAAEGLDQTITSSQVQPNQERKRGQEELQGARGSEARGLQESEGKRKGPGERSVV